MQINDDVDARATPNTDRNQNNQEGRGEPDVLHQQLKGNAFLGQDDAFLDEDVIEKFLQNEEDAASEGTLRNTSNNFKPQHGMQFKIKEEG